MSPRTRWISEERPTGRGASAATTPFGVAALIAVVLGQALVAGCAPRAVPSRFSASSAASPEAQEAPAPRIGVAVAEDPPLPGEPTDGWYGLEPKAAAPASSHDHHHHHHHHHHHGHAPASPSPSGHEGHAPASPSPSGHEGHAPASPSPSGHKGHAPASPSPSGHKGHAPASPAPSGHEGHAPAKPSEPPHAH